MAPTAKADARREADAEKAKERTARLPKIIARALLGADGLLGFVVLKPKSNVRLSTKSDCSPLMPNCFGTPLLSERRKDAFKGSIACEIQ